MAYEKEYRGNCGANCCGKRAVRPPGNNLCGFDPGREKIISRTPSNIQGSTVVKCNAVNNCVVGAHGNIIVVVQ